MKTWPDGYVEANGIKVHYYRSGGDKPQVVLNHGAMDDGLCWTRVVEELEDDYDVIMLDARGHGRSGSGQGDYGSSSRAADLIGAMEMLELDKPVIGGHSMGADTAMHAAAMRPDLVRGLFMEDPLVTMPGESIFGGELGEKGDDAGKMMANVMGLFKYLPKFLTKPAARRMMPVSPDEEIIPWLNSKKRVNNDFFRVLRNSATDFFEDPFTVLAQIEAPALLIMGDREKGAIVSQEAAQEMQKAVPDLQVVHLNDASHDIRRVEFEAYMTALKAFLAGVYCEAPRFTQRYTEKT